MAGQGTSTIDFGAFPGTSDTSVSVSVPSIAANSLVEAWVFPANTADHSVDEHVAEPPLVIAGNVQAGVGFTIYARNKPANVSLDGDRSYGVWNVAWVWN